MLADYISVEDRLRQALHADRLSPAHATRAEALLSRLVSPVRVAVLGLRGTGKTSVFNLLAGAQVLPVDIRLPTAQLSWGLPPVTACTYADRSTRQFGAATAAELSTGNPVFISMQRDLPALRKIALLDVSMDGTLEAHKKALSWAAARCDLALWCTGELSDAECRLLATLPPALRKHIIVSLTRADTLGGPDAITARMAQVATGMGDAAQSVHPVDARRAVAALAKGGPAVSETLRVSGAEALSAALFDKVDAGYARVREAAESLLEDAVLSAARAVAAPPMEAAPEVDLAAIAAAAPAPTFAHDPTSGARPAAEHPYNLTIHAAASDKPRHMAREHVAEAPTPGLMPTPAPAHRPAYASEAGPGTLADNGLGAGTGTIAGAGTSARLSQRPAERAVPAPAPVAADTAHVDTPSPAVPPETVAARAPHRLSAEGRTTVDGAIHYLTERGKAWAMTARQNPAAATEQIMSDVLGDAEWLADFLGDPFDQDEALIAPAREMANDIVDLVQLMEMERTESATTDAVCLMLQAQRRLQAVAAA